MKIRSKHILSYGSAFMVGVIIGATVFFYLSRNISAQLMIGTMLNYVTYNTSNDTRVLSHLRGSEIEKAIEILESDLDTNIITLNSLRHDNEILSIEDKEKINIKLKYAKRYRLDNPRNNKNTEIGKLVEDALSNISTE